MVNGHVAHQPVCRLCIAGKGGGEQLLVTFKTKTLIPRRTFADTILQALQFALQGMQRHQLFCQRQAGIKRTCRLDTGFLNKRAVGEERGRHSGSPYHQHADSGHQCGTQPRKAHRAAPRVIAGDACPDRRRQPRMRCGLRYGGKRRAEHQATQTQGGKCAACQQRFQNALPVSDTPLCKGMGQTQQKIMAVIGQQLRHALFRQWQGLCFQHCSQLFRGTAFRQQAADALQRASGLIITVVTDLPQIEWGLKTESLTAVDQLAPAFVELRCLTALFFCQWPDDAVQRTAAAQFF